MKKDFIISKAEIDKLEIAKLVNVPTSLNNLKTKVDDLDVGKLKIVPVDLKNLSDVADNEVVKNTKFDTLKTLNNLDENNPDATTLIHINQYNADKQNLGKKIADVDIIHQTLIFHHLFLFVPSLLHSGKYLRLHDNCTSGYKQPFLRQMIIF